MRPRATSASQRNVEFSDGSDLSVDAVIFATGADFDHSWIEPPTANENDAIQHRRGVTTVEGLYFLGLPWQHTRGSALLGWVKDDAEYLADQITIAAARTDTAPRLDPAPAVVPA